MGRQLALRLVQATALPLVLLAVVVDNAGAKGPVVVAAGWEYRWDDQTQWKPMDIPSNPPGRGERTLLHLRTELPETVCRDAAILIESIDTIATVFADGREIYSHGDPRTETGRVFRGWPWHLISIPEGTSSLSFLVYSNYRDIGLWGRVLFGEKSEILSAIYLRDLVRIALAAVSFALALVLLFTYNSSTGNSSYLHLALVLMTLVSRSITESYVRQLVLDAPLLWEYISAFTNLMLPAVAALFLSGFITGRPAQLMRYAFWALTAFTVLSILGALVGFYPVSAVYAPADIILAVFIVVSSTTLVRRLFVGSLDIRFLAAGFVGVGIIGIVSILVVYQILPWTDIFEDAALAFFGLMLFLAIGVRAVTVQRELREKSHLLERLNAELERTVEDRTRELKDEKNRFEQMSITDALTGLFNRRHLYSRLGEAVSYAARYNEPLSVAVMDLDHFKSVNDTHGHLFGDSVLMTVAELIKSHLRESDIACRYGGEEFVVVLPNTGPDGAFEVAERIRRAVRDHQWEHRRVPVTMSGGVAAVDTSGEPKVPETLLSEADQAMYRAKMLGRDRTMRFADIASR